MMCDCGAILLLLRAGRIDDKPGLHNEMSK